MESYKDYKPVLNPLSSDPSEVIIPTAACQKMFWNPL